MPRFNLPLSEEDAFVSLMSAIKVEVEFRRREFVATEELKAQVRRLSTFLTQENCKFGVVLAGGCGNGKTTIIKALQSLVNVLHIPNPYTDKEYVMRIIDAKSMVAIRGYSHKAIRKSTLHHHIHQPHTTSNIPSIWRTHR